MKMRFVGAERTTRRSGLTDLDLRVASLVETASDAHGLFV